MNHRTPFRTTLSRRQALGLAAAGGAALLLPQATHATTRLRFVTPFNFSLSYSPVFYAVTQGYFAKEGLDVEVINGKGASLAAQLVIASQADVGHTGSSNYIIAKVNSAAPLIAIATFSQVSPFYLISSPAAPIKAAADMKGKTIGVASLGGSQFGTLNNVLRLGGVDPDSVNKVTTNDGPASYGLIQAKRIDGYVGPIHTLVHLPDAVKMPLDDGLPSQVYVVRERDLPKNEDMYVKFLGAVHRAASELLDAKDVKPMIASISSKFQLVDVAQPDIAVEALRLYLAGLVAKGRQNLLRNVPASWDYAARMMAETRVIDKKVDAGTLYTNRLRDRINA
ncbi:MAG: ABC transporter substrate-binding protein [Burkholderiales bacterium]|nr:ABC transporter substrate-binding protein [Burkholderiales bacterium]